MTTHICKLTRLGGPNKSALRTSDIHGWCQDLPTIDKSFKMWSEPLDPTALCRIVETSIVAGLDTTQADDGIYLFETKTGSQYKLAVMELEEGES